MVGHFPEHGMGSTLNFISVKSYHCTQLRVLNQVVFNVLKNQNPLKDDEASALLDAAVLVLALFWGSLNIAINP